MRNLLRDRKFAIKFQIFQGLFILRFDIFQFFKRVGYFFIILLKFHFLNILSF